MSKPASHSSSHNPASERASNHFTFNKNVAVPSCAGNPKATAQDATPCTGYPDPIQPPRFTTLGSFSFPVSTPAASSSQDARALDHVPRQSPCYLECTLSLVLPEHSYYETSSTRLFSTGAMCHAPKAPVRHSGHVSNSAAVTCLTGMNSRRGLVPCLSYHCLI